MHIEFCINFLISMIGKGKLANGAKINQSRAVSAICERSLTGSGNFPLNKTDYVTSEPCVHAQ